MTVAELITEVLGAIQRQLYAERPKEFFRDRTALKKAIALYGFECERRDWQFDVPFILSEVMNIIQVCKRQGDIEYLPTYLRSAIDQHLREHAEELNARAKSIRTATEKALGKVAPAQVRVPTAVETLALLYSDLRRQARTKRKPAVKAAAKQGELL